jgi:hypothetical protein
MKEINHVPEHNLECKIAFKLLDYVKGGLTREEQREVEELMNSDPAISDAIDGLKHFDFPAQIITIQQSLNKGILSTTLKKNRNKYKPIQFPNWIIMVLFLILFIGLTGLGIIQMLK